MFAFPAGQAALLGSSPAGGGGRVVVVVEEVEVVVGLGLGGKGGRGRLTIKWCKVLGGPEQRTETLRLSPQWAA